MSALEFQINLSGNFAGALEHYSQGVDNAEKHTHGARKELELFEAETGKAKAELGGFGLNLSAFAKGGSLLTFDMAEGAAMVLEAFKAVFEIAEKIVDAVIEVGKEMLKSAADAEDLNLAISLNVHGDKAAEAAINELGESFEKTSRFGGKQVKESLLPLLEEGLTDPKQLDDLATAATDIAARRKQGIEGVQAALGSFEQIALRREVNPKLLKGLAINAQDYFNDLGSLLGVTAAEAEKKAKEGKLQSRTLLSVALHQIAEREGGALGKADLAAGGTVNALLDRIHRLPERYFETLADSPAYEKFRQTLAKIFDALDPASPTGQRILGGLEFLGTKIGDILDSIGSDEGINFLTGAVNEFVIDIRVAISIVEKFVHVIEALFDIAVKTTAPMQRLMDIGDRLLGNQAPQADSVDKMIDQLRQGWESGAIDSNQLAHVVDSMSDDIKARFREKMGIHSPSSVFEEFGRQTIAGFERGFSGGDSAGDVADAGRSMVQAAAAVGGRQAIGGGPSIVVGDIVVQIAAGADAHEQGQIAGQAARIEIKKLLDEIGYTVGAPQSV